MPKTFGDFPRKYRDPRSARFAILPVPYDGTSTYGKGADKGPAALLKASSQLENYNIETRSEGYKHGIYVEKPVTEKRSPESMVAAVEKRVTEILKKNKFCITLGGEHSITPGAVRAHAKKHKNLSVLQLDAHTDMRESFHDSKNNHACAMARVKKHKPVQVGIRSLDKEEFGNIDMSRVFFAKDIHDNTKWMDKAIARLGKNVYITVDLDVFDPSVMPSTGTPEPGGLDWYTIITFLKKVSEKRNIVGFDVVELLPRKSDPAPDFLAAKLVYTLLSYIFVKRLPA